MKKLMSFLGISTALILMSSMLISFAVKMDPKPWVVPAEYKSMKNPQKDATAGKADYDKACASCHGKKGLGDGPKAKMCETPSGDFSLPAFHSQTDGELFYKTKFGRGEMPAYKGKLDDEVIWDIVNYMKTFKK